MLYRPWKRIAAPCATAALLLMLSSTAKASVTAAIAGNNSRELAAETKKQKKKLKTKQKKVKPTTEEEQTETQAEDDSEGEMPLKGPKTGSQSERRSSKKFGSAVGFGFVIGGSALGTDLEGYWFQSKNLSLGLGYMSANSELEKIEDADFTTENFRLSAQLIGLRSRYFFGESFNMSAFLGQRVIRATVTIQSKSSTDKVDLAITTNSLMFGITVGNHWVLANGLTLGADWIGYFVPLDSSSKSTTKTEGRVTAVHDELAKESAEGAADVGKAPNGQLLVATIGYSF